MRLNPIRVASSSISNVTALCRALDIQKAELDAALALSADERYRARKIPKSDGSERTVHNPHHLIRKIQRRLNRRFFANPSVIQWPDHVFGSIPNDDLSTSPAAEKDYVNCARQHCGAKSILSVDIKNFFDNIHRDKVHDVFEDFFKYPTDVAKALADVCCKEDHVVQGALTSSYIATLCLYDIEGRVVANLRRKGLVYTRLVDDITVSSRLTGYDFSYALRLIESMVDGAGLPLNTSKTRIQSVGMRPLLVHGLRVDFSEPRLPPEEPRKIRASVKQVELLAASPGYRASRAYRRDFNRCLGRVNKLARVNHIQHLPLLKRLQRIAPLPSHKDIERAEKQIARLEHDILKPGYKDTYWFYKRWNVASERLTILKRSFPETAKDMRDRLRKLHPKKAYE